MKWPNSLVFIRHGESAYNSFKKSKDLNETYQEFRKLFEKEYPKADRVDWPGRKLTDLAKKAWSEFKLGISDYNTPLTPEGVRQAEETGRHFSVTAPLPDIIYVSPYLRTRQTLEGLIRGCPKLSGVKVISEERIREQEHGLSTVYNDWRIYLTFHPEQALLRKLETDYEYRFLNGENKADVRDRGRSFLGTLVRERAGRNVLMISHHLTLLSMRANLERWDREKFMEVDENDKPLNCGVTIYKCDPTQGKDGKLLLDAYNKKLY